VGHGPFPTQLNDAVGNKIREIGHEYGTTTGRPRRVGWLDLVPLRSAIRLNGITSFAMMKLDTISGINPIKVCVAYRYKGKLLKDFPLSRHARENSEPVYETFPGFAGDLTTVRKFEDLPATARSYVLAIEKKLGVPIEIVSVGPGREQTILRRLPAGKGSLGKGTFRFS
jgi:adenylosuccinate synthase